MAGLQRREEENAAANVALWLNKGMIESHIDLNSRRTGTTTPFISLYSNKGTISTQQNCICNPLTKFIMDDVEKPADFIRKTGSKNVVVL